MGRTKVLTDEQRRANAKESSRKWKEKNGNTYSKEYYEKHKGEFAARAKKYNEDEEVRAWNVAKNRLWRDNNPDKVKEYNAKYLAGPGNREKALEKNRLWREQQRKNRQKIAKLEKALAKLKGDSL